MDVQAGKVAVTDAACNRSAQTNTLLGATRAAQYEQACAELEKKKRDCGDRRRMSRRSSTPPREARRRCDQ
jgi:predicted kinase